MIWYDMIWYDMTWHDMTWHDTHTYIYIEILAQFPPTSPRFFGNVFFGCSRSISAGPNLKFQVLEKGSTFLHIRRLDVCHVPLENIGHVPLDVCMPSLCSMLPTAEMTCHDWIKPWKVQQASAWIYCQEGSKHQRSQWVVCFLATARFGAIWVILSYRLEDFRPCGLLATGQSGI